MSEKEKRQKGEKDLTSNEERPRHTAFFWGGLASRIPETKETFKKFTKTLRCIAFHYFFFGFPLDLDILPCLNLINLAAPTNDHDGHSYTLVAK